MKMEEAYHMIFQNTGNCRKWSTAPRFAIDLLKKKTEFQV